MEINSYYTTVIYIMTALVGLCVGSFLNVVIYRIPRQMSISKPASHCTNCDYSLKWYDNIPVLSYIILGGKCRKCKTPISPRYMIVEIANAVLWIACLLKFGINDILSIICAACAAVACSVCICIAFIDLEYKLIYDRFQIIMALLAVLFTVGDSFASLMSHIIAAVAGGLIFLFVGKIVSKRVGKEALGGGDVKFAAVSGLFLGWERLLVMMLTASISASVILLIKSKSNSEKNTEYPFAPFLTAGFVLAVLLGEIIISAYLHLLGLE